MKSKSLKSYEELTVGETLVCSEYISMDLPLGAECIYKGPYGGHTTLINIEDKNGVKWSGIHIKCFARAEKRELLTWEGAQLLPVGTKLEVVSTYHPDTLKAGEVVLFLGLDDNGDPDENYVVIKNNYYVSGHFYPKMFYMPEIKNGSELYHKIKIAEHQKALDNLNKNEYDEKYQKAQEQFEETVRNLKKEYGIAE